MFLPLLFNINIGPTDMAMTKSRKGKRKYSYARQYQLRQIRMERTQEQPNNDATSAAPNAPVSEDLRCYGEQCAYQLGKKSPLNLLEHSSQNSAALAQSRPPGFGVATLLGAIKCTLRGERGVDKTGRPPPQPQPPPGIPPGMPRGWRQKAGAGSGRPGWAGGGGAASGEGEEEEAEEAARTLNRYPASPQTSTTAPLRSTRNIVTRPHINRTAPLPRPQMGPVKL